MHDIKKYPYSYRAFGLNVLSQMPVTGFDPIPVETADVHIIEGIVPRELDKIINKGVLYESNETEFLLRIENIGSFHIINGKEIVVQRLGIASNGEISTFLTGTSFGALLLQRKMLPLHACAVQFNDQCFLFAGMSGAGKSTLAMALVKAGGILIADDISVIDFSMEKPAVFPAYPAVKIWEDSLKFLGISCTELEPVRGKLNKYHLPVSKFSHSIRSINHIFILATHNRQNVEIKSVKGFDKFRILKRHTYLFRGIPKTSLEQSHFFLTSQLAMKVPVTILIRSGGEFNVNKLIKAITEIQ